MNHYPSKKCEKEFQRNWNDWFAGGPRETGWTRTGPWRKVKPAKLVTSSRTEIWINQGLEKNPNETAKWHLDFLRNSHPLEDTAYYREYLRPRYTEEQARKRAEDFLLLRDDIERNGVKTPIWVADIEQFNLGFRYFRFNGCHRLCCAKVLGHETVPAYIFSTEALVRGGGR